MKINVINWTKGWYLRHCIEVNAVNTNFEQTSMEVAIKPKWINFYMNPNNGHKQLKVIFHQENTQRLKQ